MQVATLSYCKQMEMCVKWGNVPSVPWAESTRVVIRLDNVAAHNTIASWQAFDLSTSGDRHAHYFQLHY